MKAKYMIVDAKNLGKCTRLIRETVTAMGLEGKIEVTCPEVDELKEVIRCLHKIYYDADRDPRNIMEFNRHMEAIWNFAEITETLIKG